MNQAEGSGEQGSQGNWLPNSPQNGPPNSTPAQLDQNEVIAASRDWLSILLMTFGENLSIFYGGFLINFYPGRVVSPSLVSTCILEGEKMGAISSTASRADKYRGC